MRPATFLPAAGLLAVATLLSGCGAHPTATTPSASGPLVLRGLVHGGQQPVGFSTIQLYTVGTASDGSPSTPLLNKTVTTDAGGNFTITGDYSCIGATEVYLTATGGYVTATTQNPNLVMMAALGPCSSLGPSTYITMNELTTVAAVNALYPYMTSVSAIGSGTSDTAALDAAFTLAGEFVNTATGSSPGIGIPSGYAVPTAEINTLGDTTATCINSGGGHAPGGISDGTACGNFFSWTTPTSGTAPTDTLTALLNLAKNPTLSTANIFYTATPSAPFQTTLSAMPANFSISLQPILSLQVSPISVNFPPTAVGLTASSLPFTITNTSVSGTVTISSIVMGGSDASQFSIASNGCGSTLTPGSTCTVQVSATPTTTGPKLGSVAITSNATGSPQYELINLTATPAQQLTLSPTSITFPNTTELVTATAIPVTITNTGSVTVTLSSIALAGASASVFSQTNNCTSTLAAGAHCTAQITATPTAATAQTASLVVTSNGANSPQSVPLSVTGVSPTAPGALTVSASTLGWTLSKTYQDLTLTNTGAVPITFTTATGTTAFTTDNTGSCGGVIAALGSCIVTIESVGGLGSTADTLIITSNASNSPQSVMLQANNQAGVAFQLGGFGIAGPFGAIGVGSSSSETMVLGGNYYTGVSLSYYLGGANPGDFTLTDCSATVSGYAQLGNCSGSQQSRCTASFDNGCAGTLTFTPSATGQRSARLYFTSAYNPVQNNAYEYVPLSGTGTASAITLNPTSLTFAATPVGGHAEQQVLQVTNTGSTAVSISFQTIAITGTNPNDFSATTYCPSSLAAGASCTMQIAYYPTGTATGPRSATLTVNGSAPVALSGTAVTASTGPVTLSPTSLFFGPGNTQQMVTLTNSGTDPLGIAYISLGTTNYSEIDNCGGSVPAQSTCSIYVTAAATGGSYADTLSVIDSAGTQTVSLATTSASTITENYGAELVGNSVGSGPQYVTENTFLYANANFSYYGGVLNFTNPTATISTPGANYFSNGGSGCSSNLSSCTVYVYFTAQTLGWQYDSATDTANKTYLFEAYGVNSGAGIVASPSALSFGNTLVSSSSTLSVTVSSAGQTAFTYSGITIAGANASDFSLVSTTCSTLAAVASTFASIPTCTVTLKFNPQAVGFRTATVSINGSGTSASVAVTGHAFNVLPVTSTAAAPTLPASVSFSNVAVNTTGAAKVVTITVPTKDAAIAQVIGTGFAFVGPSNCAQGASACTVTLTLTPAATGPITGTLIVTDLTTGAFASTPLSGTGQ